MSEQMISPHQFFRLKEKPITIDDYNDCIRNDWDLNLLFEGRERETYRYISDTISATSSENLFEELFRIPNFAQISVRKKGRDILKGYRRDFDSSDSYFFDRRKLESFYDLITRILDNYDESYTISTRFQSCENIDENRRRQMLVRYGDEPSLKGLSRLTEERSMVIFRGETSKNIFAYRAKIPVPSLHFKDLFKISSKKRRELTKKFSDYTIEAILKREV
jgi:hypothetical protein